MADTMHITETAADGSKIEIEVIEASEDSTAIEDVIEALSGGTDEADLDEALETEASAAEHHLAAEEDDNDDDVSAVWVDDDGNVVDTAEETAPLDADHPSGVMTVDEAYDQINNNHESHGPGMTVDEAYANLETGNASVTVEEAYADLAHSTAQTMNAAQNIPGFTEQMQNNPEVANLFNLPQAPDAHHVPGAMTVDQAYDQINNNHDSGIGMNVDEAYASLGNNQVPAWDQHHAGAADHSHTDDNDGE